MAKQGSTSSDALDGLSLSSLASRGRLFPWGGSTAGSPRRVSSQAVSLPGLGTVDLSTIRLGSDLLCAFQCGAGTYCTVVRKISPQRTRAPPSTTYSGDHTRRFPEISARGIPPHVRVEALAMVWLPRAHPFQGRSSDSPRFAVRSKRKPDGFQRGSNRKGGRVDFPRGGAPRKPGSPHRPRRDVTFSNRALEYSWTICGSLHSSCGGMKHGDSSRRALRIHLPLRLWFHRWASIE